MAKMVFNDSDVMLALPRFLPMREQGRQVKKMQEKMNSDAFLRALYREGDAHTGFHRCQ